MNKAEYLREKLQAGNATPLDVRNAVLESNLSSACKLTLLAILSHRTNDNAEPMVGLRRLASLASMKTDTVNRALDELQRRGVLNFVHAPRKATRYDLSNVATALLNLPPFSTAKSVTKGVTNVTAVPNQGTDAVSPNGTDDSKPPTPSVPNQGQICPNPGVSTVPNGGTKEDSEEDLEEDDRAREPDYSNLKRKTPIPANFALHPDAIHQAASEYRVSEEVIREAVREFLKYWADRRGEARDCWQSRCRDDLAEKHKRGKLEAIAKKLADRAKAKRVVAAAEKSHLLGLATSRARRELVATDSDVAGPEWDYDALIAAAGGAS